MDDAIGDLMNASTNPTIGLLASPEFVRIRITAKANSDVHAMALIDPVAAVIHERLAGRIMGEDDEVLEEKVAALLRDKDFRLITLETVSGGLIAQRLMQADPSILLEGRVLPVGQGILDIETLLDMARERMLEFGANCTLCCLEAPDEGVAQVIFVTPLERYTWEIVLLGQGARAQIRLAVSVLESIRRELTRHL